MKRVVGIVLLGLSGLACFAAGSWAERHWELGARIGEHLPLIWRRPAVAPVIADEDLGHVELYAFLGQSNAVGTAALPQALALQEQARVYVFGNDYRWRRRIEPLDDPRHQVDLIAIDRQYGYSAATAFARRIRQLRPQTPIGMLSCARGGSAISQWAPSHSDSTLYGACLKRVLAASASGRLAGIVFIQGERDALDPGVASKKVIHANDWAAQFAAMVAAERSDFSRERLPVVLAKLGAPPRNPGRYSGWQTVKNQQDAVALPCVASVATDSFDKQADGMHYSVSGYDQLGSSLADAIDNLRRTGCL